MAWIFCDGHCETIKFVLMKTTFSLLTSLYLLPVALCAQPTITTNEFYNIGAVIEMTNCDASAVNAGASGAGVTWNFSALGSSGGTSTTTVAHATSSVFITSNLMITLPGGLIEYVDENSTDSYINGTYDPATNITTNYNNYDESKRPVTYNTNYVDSYRVIITSPSTVGTGHITETGDAYGTLMLPTGTFTNVLRIKKIQTETDSMGGSESAFSHIVTYLWFDTLHNAPLFRLDSVNTITGSSNTAMYLALPLNASNVNNDHIAYSGYFDNSGLQINGSFEYGSVYDVVLYNIIGTKVFSEEFPASGTSRHFDVGGNLREGIYIVSITPKEAPSSRALFKLVKQ
jgi:hypothetical protein